MGAFLEDPDAFRRTIAPLIYEDPSFATDEAIRINAAPLVSSAERKDAFNRYVGLQDTTQLVVVADELRSLRAPCAIFWGTDDVFFPTKWAYWLAGALPGAERVVELPGAKLFFPEERAPEFNRLLREFWARRP